MAITDRHGVPVAVHVASASPHETRLVEATLQQTFAPRPPQKLMGDRAYDSDPLDKRLQSQYGVELIAPHKANRSQRLRTEELYAVIVGAGRWNASSLGCTTSGGWSFVGNTMNIISSAWSS